MFQKHHIITINSVVFKVIFELVPIAGFPSYRGLRRPLDRLQAVRASPSRPRMGWLILYSSNSLFLLASGFCGCYRSRVTDLSRRRRDHGLLASTRQSILSPVLKSFTSRKPEFSSPSFTSRNENVSPPRVLTSMLIAKRVPAGGFVRSSFIM